MSDSTEHKDSNEPIKVVAIEKSYWTMSDDEKREFVTQLLRGFRPAPTTTTDDDSSE